VRGHVHHPGCRQTADEDGKGSQYDRIRRSYARQHVGDSSLW
jgi:hypothetical protein